MSVVFLTVNSLTALIAIWGSVCALNKMKVSSSTALRAAHILLAVGAASVLLAPYFQGRGPTTAELLLVYGAAVLTSRGAFKRFFRYSLRSLRWTLLKQH